MEEQGEESIIEIIKNPAVTVAGFLSWKE